MLAAAVVLASLSACDAVNTHQGAIAISVDQGRLLFAVCESIVTSGMHAEYRTLGAQDSWVSFLEVTGTVELASGQPVSVEGATELFDEVVEAFEPELATGSQVSLAVYSSDKTEANFTAAFDLEKLDFEDGFWLHPDGSRTRFACPASSN